MCSMQSLYTLTLDYDTNQSYTMYLYMFHVLSMYGKNVYLASWKILLVCIFNFTYCRWAVSTVMTRQNQIPTQDGGKMTFALIPLWDMCNHCNGLVCSVV